MIHYVLRRLNVASAGAIANRSLVKHRKLTSGPLLVVTAVLMAACGQALAAPTASTITVTDIVGRAVTVKQPVERIILDEGRQIYIVAALDREDPFKRIVGWSEDLKTADLDAYNKYQAKFPKLADIPVFGHLGSGQFSAEKAIELKPDVVVLSLDSYATAQESGLIAQLAKVGIPTVVIDYRQYPLEHTAPSTILLGKLLDREERAQQVVDFYLQQLNQVYSRIANLKKPRPTVFLYRAAGLGDCCGTFGRANLGLLLERAGGVNLGSELVPGWSGTINPEKVLVADPDAIIVTGSNWTHYAHGGLYVSLGYAAQPDAATEQLKRLVASLPGWSTLKAVKNQRVHAIWHQFYNSPYHFVALQQFAKWVYPEEFKDVDPEHVFKEFHARFLPIDHSGTFWASLGSGGRFSGNSAHAASIAVLEEVIWP